MIIQALSTTYSHVVILLYIEINVELIESGLTSDYMIIDTSYTPQYS